MRRGERKSNHEDKIYNYYHIHIHAQHFNQIGKTLFLSFKGRLDWSVGYEEPCKGLLQVDDADERLHRPAEELCSKHRPASLEEAYN